jgi:hybrid cluster-associated redox disulfide protein
MSSGPASSLRFKPATIVADALAIHPKARWVFAAYHIGGCSGCSEASRETLEEVASSYRIPLEGLLRDLNALL